MAKQEEVSVSAPTAEGAERRLHSRVHVPLKARFLGADGVERPCLVINISAGGALLRAKTTPAEKEAVVLYVDEIGRFEGKVVRAGKHSFAVDYRGRRAKSKRTADALTMTLHSEGARTDRRATPRIKQESHASVILENGEEQPCSILDISLTGASIEIEPRPPLGAKIILGKMSAKVVRRHEKGVGVVFTGSAKRMEDAINQATGAAEAVMDGTNIAGGFGRKGLTA